MGDREVRDERSGYRDPDLGPWHCKHGFDYPVADPNDIDLSRRHRKWGWHCPGVDIDWLFLDYDNRIPVSLTDYKLRASLNGWEPNRSDANNLALSRLCKNIPFYVTVYTKHPWTFRPIWINTQAKQLAPRNPCLTEAGYVEWLYWLRDRVADSSITGNLDAQITWETLSPSHISNSHNRHKRRRDKLPVPTLFDQTPVLQTAMWEVPV